MKIDFSELGKTLLHGLGNTVAVGWVPEEDLSPLVVTYRGVDVKYERKLFKDLRIETFDWLDHGFVTEVRGVFLGWDFNEDAEAFVPLRHIYWFMDFIERLTDMRVFEENLEFFLPEKAGFPLVAAYPGVRGTYVMFAAPQYPPELPQEGWE